MSRPNPRPTSRGRGIGQRENPWGRQANQKDHVQSKRGGMNLSGRHNRNQQRRGPNGGGKRRNRGIVNQVQQQPKPAITAGQLNTHSGMQQRLQYPANCGIPTFHQQWPYQQHIARPDLVPGTNPAINPGGFYATQQPAPNQQPNAQKDNRNRAIESPPNVPPNTQAMQGQLYTTRQQLGNPQLSIGFDQPMPMGIPIGQNAMGQQILRQPAVGLGRGVSPQIKTTDQPGQPSQPNSQPGDQMSQQSAKDNVNKPNPSGSKPPGEADNQPVAFGQHSMSNIRQGASMVPAPPMNRTISAPPFYQYAIPSGWNAVQSQMLTQSGLMQGQMVQPSFPQPSVQHCFPAVGYMQLNSNMQLNNMNYIQNHQPAIVAVPNPVNTQKLNLPRHPNIHNQIPKNATMIPSTDQTTAAREMRQKFEWAAQKQTPLPGRPTPQPTKHPTPAPQVSVAPIEPEEEIKPPFAAKSPGSNRGLNPNARDFTPCTPNVINSPSFLSANQGSSAFTQSKPSQPAPIPKPPQTQTEMVQPSILEQNNVGEQNQDDMAKAWLGKRPSSGEPLQDEGVPPLNDEVPPTIDPPPTLDGLLGMTPRKGPSAAQVDDEEHSVKEASPDVHTNDEDPGSNTSANFMSNTSAKMWGIPHNEMEDSADDDKLGSDQEDAASNETFCLKRLRLTGEQKELEYSITYSKEEFVKLQSAKDMSELPDEIDNSKVKRAHFRQFQGPSSRVAELMKKLSEPAESAAASARGGRQNPGGYNQRERPPSNRQRGQRTGPNMRQSHSLTQRQDDDTVMLDRKDMGTMGSKKARRRAQPPRQAWKPLGPTSKNAYLPNVGRTWRNLEYDEMVGRKVKSFLNKITPDKFEAVTKKLVEFCQKNIKDFPHMKKIAQLVFEKACQEPPYSHLYAELCQTLSQSLQFPQGEEKNPEVEGSGEKKEEGEQPQFRKVGEKSTKNPFRRALLSECQTMFDKGTVLEEHTFKDTQIDQEELIGKTKRKVMGNMKFIGELFKLKLIHERIVHRCIQNLLTTERPADNQSNPVHKPISKMDLEAAVNLLKTTGKDLDRVSAKKWVDQYFNYLRHHANSMKDKRLMFMVRNLEDLRQSCWESSKEETKVMTKAAVKEEHRKNLEKNHQTRRRDRDPQANRRLSTPQGRNRPSNRSRSTASTRRPLAQSINNNSGKVWTTPGNSQDVRSQLPKRGSTKLDQSLNMKKGGTARPGGRAASPKALSYIPESHSGSYSRSQRDISPDAAHPKEYFSDLWPLIQDTVNLPGQENENNQAGKIRKDAIREITRSKVEPVDFICDCLVKYFESSKGLTAEHRAELANLLTCLGNGRYYDFSTFQEGINMYTRRFEEYISDSPKMVIYTVELVDRVFDDKETVIRVIDGMLEIMKAPKADFNEGLCNKLGQALFEYMDIPGKNGEREKLRVELDKRDLSRFFTFKSNKNDGGKPGTFNAKRFFKEKPRWLAKAGFN